MAPRVRALERPLEVTTVNPVAFYVISAAILVGAVAVVVLRNLVHAVYALAGTLAAVGILYLAVGADVLAGAQILLAAVAVPAMLLVALALTRGGASARQGGHAGIWPITALVALAFVATVIGVVAVGHDEWRFGAYPQSLLDSGTGEAMGRLLLGRYALPFEVAAVLLFTALVGAATLARRDEREIAVDEAERLRRLRAERAARRREERERARGRVAAAAGDGADAEAGA